MPRPRGSGSIYLQNGRAVWWVKYYRNGKSYRESTRTTEKSKAQQFLRKRLAEITTGDFYGPRCEKILIDELAADLIRDYRINDRKSLPDVDARWRLHLKPFFGNFRAVDISSDLLSRYVDSRQQKGAKNATINRELAALKRMFYLARKTTPPKVYRVPVFSILQEDNARKGFLEDQHYENLLGSNSELWFRSIVEVGKTYGWRISELLRMRVNQVDLLSRTIRLFSRLVCMRAMCFFFGPIKTDEYFGLGFRLADHLRIEFFSEDAAQSITHSAPPRMPRDCQC